jgi:hypothetical protein
VGRTCEHRRHFGEKRKRQRERNVKAPEILPIDGGAPGGGLCARAPFDRMRGVARASDRVEHGRHVRDRGIVPYLRFFSREIHARADAGKAVQHALDARRARCARHAFELELEGAPLRLRNKRRGRAGMRSSGHGATLYPHGVCVKPAAAGAAASRYSRTNLPSTIRTRSPEWNAGAAA